MQLTNYSFLESRRDYLSAQTLQKTAMQRLSTGTKLERSGSDTGALSQSMRGRLEKMADRTFITNLQNTKSFLQSQQSGLLKTREIYGRMETLSIRAMDPTSSGQDRADYNDEFKSLTEQLN